MPTIAVQVDFYSPIKEVTGKRRQQIALAGETTVFGLIKTLAEEYGTRFADAVVVRQSAGHFEPRLSLEKCSLRPGLVIFVNGRPSGLETVLKDGDEVAFIAAIAGG